MKKPAPNRIELTLEQRGAIHILKRAIGHINKLPAVTNAEAKVLAQNILNSCASAIFHGGDAHLPKRLSNARELLP